MEKKINVAELLKDCPKGMELDCTMYEDVSFVKIIDSFHYPIAIKTKSGFDTKLTKYGQSVAIDCAKCVIFPKGKTTWDGFVPPCKFKDGDIVFTTLGNIAIIRKPIGGELFSVYGIMVGNCFYKDETVKCVVERHATEEEKQKLFNAIKENGYKWNAETKTLEKLIKPKFKVEDTIQDVDGYKVEIYKVDIDEECYEYISITENGIGSIPFEQQDKWELVPNKFDITTLKPFDKVLVRDNDEQMWTTDIFSFYNEKHVYHFMCVGHYTNQCIPYEQNKHLLGTTSDCDDFYKTWE